MSPRGETGIVHGQSETGMAPRETGVAPAQSETGMGSRGWSPREAGAAPAQSETGMVPEGDGGAPCAERDGDAPRASLTKFDNMIKLDRNIGH